MAVCYNHQGYLEFPNGTLNSPSVPHASSPGKRTSTQSIKMTGLKYTITQHLTATHRHRAFLKSRHTIHTFPPATCVKEWLSIQATLATAVSTHMSK